MNPIVRNILAVVAALIIGSAVNMGILMLFNSIIPLPAGVDPMNPESLAAALPSFEAKHFVGPFLAHALGTLVGGLVISWIAATRKRTFALVLGVFFMLGGIYNAITLGGPMWFNILDVVVAYVPMALIGHRLAPNKG